jgi:hypothetical protein
MDFHQQLGMDVDTFNKFLINYLDVLVAEEVMEDSEGTAGLIIAI